MSQDLILQKGDVGKFQISITHDDFDMEQDDFFVILRWGFLNQKEEILKEQMFSDEDGKWFFTFDTDDMAGQIEAECHYFVPDTDIDGNVFEEVDRQWLCFVASTPCPKFPFRKKCACQKDPFVTYTRVWARDIYFGSGQTYTDATQKVTAKASAAGIYDVVVRNAADYIFFNIPASMDFTIAEMGGFEFPLDPPTNVTIDGMAYESYRSCNTYDSGTARIIIY